MNAGAGGRGMEPFLRRLELAAKGTFWDYLGCRVAEAEPDGTRVKVELDVRPHHLNAMGILNGGVHASLLDNTMGLVAMCLARSTDVVTTHLHIHYTAPLGAGRLLTTAEVVYRTRRTITVQGRITDEQGGIGALATASFRIV